MSAALQLPMLWSASAAQAAWQVEQPAWECELAARPEFQSPVDASLEASPQSSPEPAISLAFYRKHTERLLQRYLYASMQVGRAPSILGEPVARGWASSRPVRTFEDAVIFVLDIERQLDQLGAFDRMILSRIVIQEYTHEETAAMLGMCVKTISNKFSKALDRLTEKLLEAGLLVLPH
jgi:hypothetical protein